MAEYKGLEKEAFYLSFAISLFFFFFKSGTQK